MGDSKEFLILGMANGGLFLARQLRKEWPDASIYAIGEPDDIGRYSNTLKCFYPASSEDEVIEGIKDVIEAAGGERVRAFMCSNPMLECVVLHHPELFDFLDFENDIDLYRRIVDKTEVDRLCRSLNIPRPDEYDLMSPGIHFPVVVKPLEKMSTIGASKCAYIDSQEELDSYMERMSRINVNPKDLVCQQCVKGDNRWEYGYGGYFVEGKATADIFFHQFIQVPQGLCCYSREMTDSSLQGKILDTVRPFLDETHYNGFLEFDIKQDQESKMLYVLDINPRPWRSVDMLAAKLGDSTVFSPKPVDLKVVWRYPYRELFRGKNGKNVSYKMCKSLSPGQFATQHALKDDNDKNPYKRQVAKDRKDLLKLIRQKIHK